MRDDQNHILANLEGTKMDKTQENNRLPQIVDVIVVGSGFAGLTTAIEASLGQAEVIVLEKMKAVGGNSIISDGGIAAWGTQEQKDAGISDSSELMYADMMQSGEGRNDPEIVRLVCENSLDAYEWSKNFLGVEYQPRVNLFGGHHVPRCYTPQDISGVSMIMKMKEKLESLNVPIHLGVSVDSFILEVNQHVVGVRVNDDFSMTSPQSTNLREIYARKGVVIASGGFAADVNFRQSFDQKLTHEVLTTNKRSATSELLQACMNIGAKTANLDVIQCTPWTTPDEYGYGKGALFGDYIVSSYGVLIDIESGKRFVNELGNRKSITDKLFEMKQGVIGIADAYAVGDAGWDLQSVIQRKIVKTFPEIEELAEYYKIPKEILVNTIYEYNGMVLREEDDAFQKPIAPWMKPIRQAPFYAMRMIAKTHYTSGGLVTDTQGRVFHQSGSIIQGLYAVGEVTGITHGANRLGSCSVTECLVMGRVIGKSVSKT